MLGSFIRRSSMNVYRCAIPRVFVSNYCSNNKLSETASMFQGFTNTEEILMNNDPMFVSCDYFFS